MQLTEQIFSSKQRGAPDFSEKQITFSFSKKKQPKSLHSTTQLQSTPDVIPLSDEDRRVVDEMKDMFWPKSGFRFAFDPTEDQEATERFKIKKIELFKQPIHFKKEDFEALRKAPDGPINYFKVAIWKVVIVASKLWNFFFPTT